MWFIFTIYQISFGMGGSSCAGSLSLRGLVQVVRHVRSCRTCPGSGSCNFFVSLEMVGGTSAHKCSVL